MNQSAYNKIHPGTVPEVVGLFDTTDNLQEAIRQLEGTAFPRQDISIMGTRRDLEKIFGTKAVSPMIAADDAHTPRQAPARPEEEVIGGTALVGASAYIGAMGLALSAGAIAFPVAGAAIIGGLGGGVLGGILARILDQSHNRHLEEQIERGGLLLWVRTPDENKESLAINIMTAHGGRHVHAHTIT